MKSSHLKIAAILVAAPVVGYCFCFLLPVTSFEKVEVTSYESRYIEGAGNVATTSRHKTVVPAFRRPTSAESLRRFVICLIAYTLIAMIGLLFFLRWRRLLHKEGRRLVFRDRELLPIEGEPIKGEVLMPIRAIEVKRSLP